MPFVSVNSWSTPGTIYQAEEPVEIVQGGPDDWHHLAKTLDRYSRSSADSQHPPGAAIGYFSYDGHFWFGFFPKLEVREAEIDNALWHRRRMRHFRTPAASSWRSNQTQAEFEQRVMRAQEYIRSGDIYQVNLAQRFNCEFQGNPYALFEQLLWRSPAPGGAFLDTGSEYVLSASPELFLKIQGRHIITRPIKGTRPRARNPLRDQQLAYELISDPKELAELIMITDLERNDLGQICEYGSVTVTDLVRLERFAQVYHLVSTVEGMLRPGISTLEALRSCFPGGSITGAPKKRAMEIIAELEPAKRGIYTGAIGYFGFNGDAAFSIAIRTMVLQQQQLYFYVGSGITADSIPTREYEETLHKASGMQHALQSYLQTSSSAPVRS